jgi:hypothetical protein
MSHMKALIALIMFLSVLFFVGAGPAAGDYSPYATEVVSYSSSLTGSSLYNDPYAVLGAPATNFANTWGSAATARVKLVEPAYNVGLDGSKLITTLNTGQYIIVKFDHQVTDDAGNPYGIDFLVFGNSFYTATSVSDATNMNTCMLSGGGTFSGAGWFENVVVSVSQDGINWYTYSNGPYGDNAYPTNAYLWDADAAAWTDTVSDFTKPVDPDAIAALIGQTGVSAADVIAAYAGSGGGTGFDLAESGYSWIQYIKVEGISGFSGGEIDAFADVAAVPIPGALWLLGPGLMGLAAARRRWRKWGGF